MYNENNNETLTNDKFCVCEDYSIPEHERAAIDRSIKAYTPLMDNLEYWIPWEKVKENMRRITDEI